MYFRNEGKCLRIVHFLTSRSKANHLARKLPFADRSEARPEDREGSRGGRGDYSQREEKSVAQLKRGIVIEAPAPWPEELLVLHK